ncbi:MAG: MamK family actin-like protein [Gammaproteobacteria bacterium]|jgi:rod shape-determining protein MreB
MAKKKSSPKRSSRMRVGIDLGTSRSAISASNGVRDYVASYVGWPKDFISEKVLGKPVLFGKEALENRLSLELVRPLEHGVIKEGISRDEEAVQELVGYLLELVGAMDSQEIYAVVGVPAESLRANKLAIKRAVQDYVDSLMVVSEPFAAAYGRGLLNNAIVIDIGAGTTDFCIMHGSMPTEDDQRTIVTAGDYIDMQLYEMMKDKYPESDFNMNMVRGFKEMYAYVGTIKGKIEVEIPVAGRIMIHDITEEMGRACESVLPAIIENAMELISRFDPEYQEIVRENIVLAGGGSQIKGLAKYIENALKEDGPCTVSAVEDPTYASADGALALAQDMPEEYWEDLLSEEE